MVHKLGPPVHRFIGSTSKPAVKLERNALWLCDGDALPPRRAQAIGGSEGVRKTPVLHDQGAFERGWSRRRCDAVLMPMDRTLAQLASTAWIGS
jgi:hypothetical protein